MDTSNPKIGAGVPHVTSTATTSKAVDPVSVATSTITEQQCQRASGDLSKSAMQETADDYGRVIIRLCPHHRVIICRDDLQWIVQRRKKGGAERPWRAVGYFLTRDALVRCCANLCSRVDPHAMAALLALPEHFRRGCQDE
ncbi:hypothetical protein [Ruegeria arenilitoris]|uniref:hypothetical protein n=1 Tax=Ruegeria arenilitoris TaxID=1173585 RepID=UPI00147E3B3A|nr:hypothetical protein [Ruegeria arenilitoris]